MKEPIFRKEALARLASPEQLDQLMPLTSPRGWLMLGTAGLLLLGGLLWAFLATIEVKVSGKGILTRPGTVQLTAPNQGVVAQVLVAAGDVVQPGSELFRFVKTDGAIESVKSTMAARVLEVMVYPGDAVEKSAVILGLEPQDQPLQAVLYFDAADGYQVDAGMLVQVQPAAARGAWGAALPGRVKSAARHPASRASMLRTLLHEDWVSSFTQAGPCLEVVVELLPESKEQIQALYSGMPCRAYVTVDRLRPIRLVFPSAEAPPGS